MEKAKEYIKLVAGIIVIAAAAVLILAGINLIAGCQSQTPSAPVYNYTITDNSAIIVNSALKDTNLSPTTKTEVTAAPDIEQEQSQSDRSLLFAILGALLIAAAGLFAWFKWGRK